MEKAKRWHEIVQTSQYKDGEKEHYSIHINDVFFAQFLSIKTGEEVKRGIVEAICGKQST